MFDFLFSLFENIEFFQTVWFGIAALPLVGAVWCVGGVVAGKAPKENFRMDELLLFSAAVGILVTALLIVFTSRISLQNFMEKPFLLTVGAFFVAGALGFFQNIFMSKAMQYGPNGRIWALVQSVMVFPFITGIVFFGERSTPGRICGIILMLTALVLMSSSKENSVKAGCSWKFYTFMTVVVVILIQLFTSIPFYYKETGSVPPLFCTFGNVAGFALAGIIPFLFRMNREKLKGLCCSLRRVRFWLYTLGMMPLTAAAIVVLQIPGMRVMADHGFGSISYPLMVGSSIIVFTLYSFILLKEKLKFKDIIANCCCGAGLACLCF